MKVKNIYSIVTIQSRKYGFNNETEYHNLRVLGEERKRDCEKNLAAMAFSRILYGFIKTIERDNIEHLSTIKMIAILIITYTFVVLVHSFTSEADGECLKQIKGKKQKEKDSGNGNWEKDGIVQCKGKYKPVPEKWKPSVTTVNSNGEEVISTANQLICEHGGIISIVKNGQEGELDHREETLGYLGKLVQGMLTDAELSTLENFFNRSIFSDINAAFEGLFYSGSKGYYGNLLAKG